MTDDRDVKATLIRADETPTASRRTSSWSLPPDLVSEAVRRVRVVALIFAVAYFAAGFLPALLSQEGRTFLFSRTILWLPGTLSITGALIVAFLLSRPGIPDRIKLLAGLVFEVLGSIGIAADEYHHIVAPVTYQYGPGGLGLSWVTAWVMLFTAVVPTTPRIAFISATLSLAAVPVMYSVAGTNLRLDPALFFFGLIFPNLIILMMAYFAARIVYGLGTAVRRAREMGSYRLVERLGKGGMGEVWRAQHQLLARPAAIKLIRPEVLGLHGSESRELLQRRFEREAQATSLMRSAHTMELYDFGVTEDGTFYYVMELLDGFDLDRLVTQFGPMPAERVIHLLRQMCASLAEAHDAGLIHRDVKPANVYVCRYGREVDFVKVLDFGLVKQRRIPEPGSDKLTTGNMAGGTPAFMSPEQALGDDQVDARSDIYAIGCVAYWLLTGTLVFKGQTPMETIVMHVNREPDPPSRRTDLPIPPDLEAVVLDCLAKNPDARPQTADELAERLSSVRLEEGWTPERARAWWDRHRPGSLPSLGDSDVPLSAASR